MSCWMVQRSTIDRIVAFIREVLFTHQGRLCMVKEPARLDCQDAQDEYGQRLVDMNADACRSRYRETFEECPPNAYVFKSPGQLPGDHWQVLKSLDCYLYQCSEGEVPETPLFKAIQRLRRQLQNALVSEIPEYKAAAWE